jgi:nucleotide-binding universal stress UspA family protein
LVACWDAKYAYWAIRPFQLDAEVKPLFAMPNHPSYPAAHSCLSGANAAILSDLFPSEAKTYTAFSAPANQAVTAAFELAQTFGAKLTVLPVVEPPPYLVDSPALSHQSSLLLKAIEEQAQPELEHRLSQPSGAQVEIARRVLVGVPHQRMTESAAPEPVDRIVTATHGRTGLRHLVLGSIAERVVRLAPCPVLTIRPPGGRSIGLPTPLLG